MPPTYRELKRYCDKNGWVLVRDSDHCYYEKTQADGTILRTKVSHALAKEIPKHLWTRILKYQLKITEKEFWQNL
ncbi:hypothetical protein [Moorella sp. Hama-1]|uniref:hypothetical protein n=1 Tax=Moorella sp. Hama-1 TaxID=2138101 RepID=UPI000D65CB24|nr:hypothetical protein [Moorella sp. Hama-1]BCV22029.1 hypothetical protein hamaS1_20980 [Moorella sp. Hama-1]